jgi:hypothetical protein
LRVTKRLSKVSSTSLLLRQKPLKNLELTINHHVQISARRWPYEEWFAAIIIIIEGQFQVFQRISSSKLVLKTVENRFAALKDFVRMAASRQTVGKRLKKKRPKWLLFLKVALLRF